MRPALATTTADQPSTDARWSAARYRPRDDRSGCRELPRGETSEARLGWLFVSPILVLIVLLVGYPLVLGLQMSAQHVGIYPGEETRFVGLDNYVQLLAAPETAGAALHTVGYWLVAVGVEVCLGLAAALALRRPFRGRGLVLALLVLPWALPPVVSGLLWTRIFDPSSGWLNGVLYSLGLIDKYQLWFTRPGVTVPLIALVHAWSLLPLVTLILLGGLQGIPWALYEAAQLDGASGRRRSATSRCRCCGPRSRQPWPSAPSSRSASSTSSTCSSARPATRAR